VETDPIALPRPAHDVDVECHLAHLGWGESWDLATVAHPRIKVGKRDPSRMRATRVGLVMAVSSRGRGVGASSLGERARVVPEDSGPSTTPQLPSWRRFREGRVRGASSPASLPGQAAAVVPTGPLPPPLEPGTLDRARPTDKAGVSGRAARRGADFIAAVEPKPRQPGRPLTLVWPASAPSSRGADATMFRVSHCGEGWATPSRSTAFSSPPRGIPARTIDPETPPARRIDASRPHRIVAFAQRGLPTTR
jgi:hypothetical protein